MVEIRSRWRTFAWIAIVVSDAGFLLWGAMAALLPQYLLGPGGRPILPAGYEGLPHGAWSELVDWAPPTAAFMTMLFRLFGTLCAVFGFLAVLIAAKPF